MRPIQIAEAFVAIRPKTDQFKADTSRAVRETGDQMERDLAESGQRAGSKLGELIAAGAAAAFVATATKSAADLEQAVGGTAAIFGEQAAQLDRFAESAADSVGLSEQAARELTSQLGGALQGYGFTVDEAADKSIRLTTLGADLAATFGGTTREAVDALSSALRGEFDPLERYGVTLNQTLIDQKAVALGLAESTSNVDLQARAQAALALITERSSQAQGQFAREADTASGQAERAAAKLANAQADLGESFLPIYSKLSQVVGAAAGAFGALPEPVQTGAIALTAMSIAAGPTRSALEGIRGIAAGLSAAFDRAAIGAYNLAGQGLGRLALQGAAGAAAVTGLVVAIQEWQKAMEAAEQQATDLGTRLAETQQTDSYEAAVARLGRIQGELGTIRRESEETATGVLDLDYAAAVGKLEGQLGASAQAMQVNLAAARALADQQGISLDAAYRQVTAQGAAKKSAEEEADAQDELAEALKRQNDQRREAEKLAMSKVEGVMGLPGAVAAYEAAQTDVATAADKLSKARTPEEQAAAYRELEAALFKQAEARLKVAEQQAKVRGEELSAADASRIYGAELDALAARFPGMRRELDAYLALLDRADDPRVADVQVKFRAAIDDPEGLFAGLRTAFGIEGGAVTPEAYAAIAGAAGKVAAARGAGRAYGGPVTAGVPYTVGERTRETFVPTEDGVIVPGPLGGGFSPTINIYGHDHSSAELAHRVMSDLDLMLTGAQR